MRRQKFRNYSKCGGKIILMKVRVVISAEIDLSEIYSKCTPVDGRKCLAAIREYVAFQINMRAGPDGGWLYPECEMIVQYLIDKGLATHRGGVAVG